MRRLANPADLALASEILLGKEGAFPFANIGGSYRNLLLEHSLDPVSIRSELAFVVGHVNGWVEEARTALIAMAHFGRIPEMPPLDSLEAIAAFVERFGPSCYAVRKVAYLMSRYDDDTSLQRPFQKIAKQLSQSKYPAPYFAALELLDTDSDYFSSVSTRIQIYQKYVDKDYRQLFPLHEVLPVPLSKSDLGAHLRKAHSTSLVDELLSLVTVLNFREIWPDLYKDFVDLIDASLLPNFEQVADVKFETRSLYDDIDPMSADMAFYQRAAAFSEFKDCARYRLYIDTLIAPRLMSGLAVSVDATIQHPIQVSLKDLTKATQGFAEPDDYLRVQSCGSFLRTIQLLSYLDRHNNRAAISAHDLRFICEHTIALDILLSEREIEALYELSDEESKPLVAVLALALYKAKSRDEDVDFKFRHSLCQTVLTQFHGKLEEFIVWLLPKTPQIANYLLTILDRQTLQKLYWLIGSADEADRTRQAILRAVGKQRNAIEFFIEADAIEAQRQVAKLRKFFDDSRIYVDGIAMKEWLVANPSTYAQQYIKMIEHDLNPVTAISASVENGKVIFTETKEAQAAALDYVLLEVAKVAFEQFCTNRQFGVESYLGRRIRHNTMTGMMRGGVEDLIDLPAYTALSYDREFVSANRKWISSYQRLIEHVRKDLLQFKSDAKPQGIFSASIRGDDTTVLGIASLRSKIIVAPNAELMNELLIRFCWLEIEPQLQAASKMITVDLVKQVNDSIQVHFSHFDEDEAHRSYKQQLRETVHERLARLGSWFRQPEDGFVNASTRQLGELILVEATDGKITENQPFEWSGDALDIQIDGLSVHRMYDCLFVTLRNALKYGAEDSLIKINVSREAQAVEGVSQIRVAVSSLFGEEEEKLSHIVRLTDSFASADLEAGMVVEGYSGIRKLRYITRTSEGVSTATFDVIDDVCTVEFFLTVELAQQERPQP